MTAALCDSGVDGIGVDWRGNKHQPTVPILNVDLTTEDGQRFVRELIAQDHVMYVHLAPPCGTYTRARERPIPKHLRRRNAPCPRPLRSEERPDGLPQPEPPFTEVERVKIEKANVLADFCAGDC